MLQVLILLIVATQAVPSGFQLHTQAVPTTDAVVSGSVAVRAPVVTNPLLGQRISPADDRSERLVSLDLASTDPAVSIATASWWRRVANQHHAGTSPGSTLVDLQVRLQI